ncbi:MAG: hypothetical protein K2O12_05495 [Muribaculaceae bacterium]|nr:hypothetical protein [Muribaculaceae bacterium]
MKKISIILAAILSAVTFGCKETWDDNPVLKTPVNSNFLNEPAMQQNEIILASTDVLNLTCSQPDFGYAAAADYIVEVSMSPDFVSCYKMDNDPSADAPGIISLTTVFHDCANINPAADEMATAMCRLMGVTKESTLTGDAKTVYIRLYAYIPEAEQQTAIRSNVVKFDKVVPFYNVVVPDEPSIFWLRGSMNGWGSADTQWNLLTTDEKNKWIAKDITLPAGTQFKISTYPDWGNPNLGSGDAGDKVTPGTPLALKNDGGSGNLNVADSFTGNIILTRTGGSGNDLKTGNYTILLEASR